MRTGLMLAALGLVMTLVLGIGAPSVALAGSEAQVRVEVVHGTKGGTGTDEKVEKHAGALSNFGGYGGWTSAGDFTLKVGLGQSVSQQLGERSFTAELIEMSADRVKLRLVVVDPRGKPHATTMSFARGAQTAIGTKSQDASEIHVFVVTTSF